MKWIFVVYFFLLFIGALFEYIGWDFATCNMVFLTSISYFSQRKW